MGTGAKIAVGGVGIVLTLLVLIILAALTGGNNAAPTPSDGSSAAASLDPNATPDPDATPEASEMATVAPSQDPGEGASRCLTGAISEQLTPVEDPPRDDKGIFSNGRGDPCSYLSVYIADVDPAGAGSETALILRRDLFQPDYAVLPGAAGIYATPGEAISNEAATDLSPVPARPVRAPNGTPDGGYRFTVTPDWTWQLVLQLTDKGVPMSLVTATEGGCGVSPAAFIIRSKDPVRLIAKIDLRKRALSCNGEEVPLADGQVLVSVRQEKFKSDEPIPSLGPMSMLNPLALGLFAGAGRVYPVAMVTKLRQQEAALKAVADPVSIGIFVIGALITIVLGSFALWVLFRANQDAAKRKKSRGERDRSKLTKPRGRRGIRP